MLVNLFVLTFITNLFGYVLERVVTILWTFVTAWSSNKTFFVFLESEYEEKVIEFYRLNGLHTVRWITLSIVAFVTIAASTFVSPALQATLNSSEAWSQGSLVNLSCNLNQLSFAKQHSYDTIGEEQSFYDNVNRIFSGCDNQPTNFRVQQVETTPVSDAFALIRDNNYTLLFSLTGIGGSPTAALGDDGTDPDHPDSSPLASYATTSGTTLSLMSRGYPFENLGAVFNVTTASTFASYGNFTTTTLEERGYTLSLRTTFFHRLAVSVMTVVNGANKQPYRLEPCTEVPSSSGNQTSYYIVFADAVGDQRDVYRCNDSTLQIFSDYGGIRTITFITLEADEAVTPDTNIYSAYTQYTSLNNEVFFLDADWVVQGNNSNFLTTLQHSQSLYYTGKTANVLNSTPAAIKSDTLFFEVAHGDATAFISVWEYTPTTFYDLPAFVTPLTVALMVAVCAVVLVKNLHPDAAAKIGRVVFLFAAMADHQNYSRPDLSRVGFRIEPLSNQRQDGLFNNGTLLGRMNAQDHHPNEEEIRLHDIPESGVGLFNEAHFLKGDTATASAKDSAEGSNAQGASRS
jgi:hypothetical protein